MIYFLYIIILSCLSVCYHTHVCFNFESVCVIIYLAHYVQFVVVLTLNGILSCHFLCHVLGLLPNSIINLYIICK